MTPSQEAMRATLTAYVDRYNAGDLAGLVALFAPTAVIEDPIGSPPRDLEAFTAYLADGITYGARLSLAAPIRGSHSNEAALVFEVEFTPPGGRPVRIRSIDTCTFDETARITRMRAFWGPDDMETL